MYGSTVPAIKKDNFVLGAFDETATAEMRATLLGPADAPWAVEVYTSAAGADPLHPAVDRTKDPRTDFNETSAVNPIPVPVNGTPSPNPMGAQCQRGMARRTIVTYVCGPPLQRDPAAADDPATFLAPGMQVSALSDCNFQIIMAVPEACNLCRYRNLEQTQFTPD